ncbi:zinc finger, C3HC4 type (RING finger) protein (macronuclear) [Tetrahymena thermophila SB210]|uniref:Zinc finger, C3HC4 type (RING finger) protein n=1 Tax=Tetrahymena thermophila (strain SB210) TaxID=312017 RepID=Q23UD8_TETTS|nr:zinc finger, C3HC4 type (RING finger) protein [Tetrahymena thermophila SB210]EAS00127.2 zinc finger, C3HC4 type (RING finger) protein [Tetrahymena thermophila SB210]|eukprot:XP_001020372.2 zinc finger, C3HC4 type (RING finger) protein [Tetrahymena thermophila SB210]
MQSQYQSRQHQHSNQFQQQFYRYSPSHQRNSVSHLQGLSRSRNESLVMMPNNQRNMSIANYTINNMMSPNFGDENRLFAFYSPSNRDLMSPQGLNNQSNSQIFHYMGQSVNNRNNNSQNIMQQYAQQYEDQQQQNQVINSMRNQINNPLQNQENPVNPIKKSTVSDKKLQQIEQRLKLYSSIVMQQTFFNHLSLQIFFILMLILILYSMQYIFVLVFLWIVDIISFAFSFKRSKIEQEVDENKQEEHSNIWRIVETTFSILFKICLYIYLEVNQYKFYYVPCTLLIYVLIRFFFVISKKLAENGPISALINECFTWGFKIFFVGQIFLISVKMNNKIDWSWQDVFWPYWVFFYIMIGTNSVFVILLLSKILLKCLGQPVQSFEIKGLFWFFLLSNGLCVNSTLFVRGAVNRLDHQSNDDAQLSFKYSLVFTTFFIIYTLFFWKGIWIFMFHFSQEREDTEGDENSQKNTSRIGKNKKKKNKNKGNESNQQQQQQQDQDGQKSNNQNKRENEGEDDEEDEEEGDEEEEDDDDEENRQRNPNDIYAEDEDYPAEQQYPESQSGRQNQGRSRNNQANISQQNNNQPGQNNQNGLPADQAQKPKPKKKIFKKVNLNNKNSQKKGFPLFLEKLSSTYFTALTNNVMKSKREKDQQKKELPSTQNKLTRANTQLDKLDKRSTSQIDMDKSKDCKEEVNKSDLQVNKKKKKGKANLQNKIDSPKGLSDSMGPVDISFNENGKTNAAQFQKSQNPLQNLAYETQLKFSQLISSPKGQELKKKEFEKKMQQQSNKELAKLNVKPKEMVKKQKSDSSQISQKSYKENGDESNANCVICFENEPDTVYLPCGHGGICYECGMDVMKKTGECYLCRHEIKQVVQIDFKSTDAQKKIIAITAALEEKVDIDADKSIINASQINGQNSDITDRSVTMTQNQIENNVSQVNISQQNPRQVQQINQQQQTQNNQQSLQNNLNQQQIQQVQSLQSQQIQQQQEPQIRNNQGIAFFDYQQQQLPLQSPHFNLALQSPNFNNIQQLPEQIQEQINNNNNNNIENINDAHSEINDQNNQQHQQVSQIALVNNLYVSNISMLQRNNSLNSNSFDFVIMRRQKSNNNSNNNNKEQNYEDNQENNQNLEESINNNLQQGTNLRGTNNNFLINFSQDLDKSNEEDS